MLLHLTRSWIFLKKAKKSETLNLTALLFWFLQKKLFFLKDIGVND